MAGNEETVAADVMEVAAMTPTSVDEVGRLWVQIQDIVAVWCLWKRLVWISFGASSRVCEYSTGLEPVEYSLTTNFAVV